MSDRRALADQFVAKCGEAAAHICPSLAIHWDDCDMDERRFWIHFREPGLLKVVKGNSPMMQQASRAIRFGKRLAMKQLEASPYECYVRLHERPKLRTTTVGGILYDDGYQTDTWIYILSFYG